MEEVRRPSRPERGDAKSLTLTWRLDELLAAGYDEGDALLLAVASQVDLHLAMALPRQGCPHKLALDILL